MARTVLSMLAVAILAASPQAVWAGGCCCQACAPVEPVCVEKVIQVPTWCTETRTIQCVECRPELRTNTITVMKRVPVVQTVDRQFTVMVPQVRTKTVFCTVAKPVWEEKQVQYTVMVPQVETKQGVRRVCRCVPVTEKRTVCKDNGHWEDREVTSCVRQVCYRKCCVARLARRCGTCCSPCGGSCCDSCCDSCCTCTETCKVWVPNIVQEEIDVTVMKPEVVEEPCEYTVTRCVPEVRTKTIRVCRMEYEQQQKEVQYVVCVPEVRTKKVCCTSYVCQPEQKTVTCTVMVPHVVQKQVQVPVCRMVCKTVKVPCCPTCVPTCCGCRKVGCATGCCN